jgi:hypothetical protein
MSLLEAGDELKAGLLRAMGNALAAKFDALLYAAILAKTANKEEIALSSKNVPDWTKFFECVVAAKKKLLAKDGNPDFVIISPQAEAALLSEAIAGGPRALSIAVENGSISMVAGLKVIVYSGVAELPATLTESLYFGAVVDSSRAVGEAFGKKPTFEEDRIPESNMFKEVVWAYYGVAGLDTDGICLLYAKYTG